MMNHYEETLRLSAVNVKKQELLRCDLTYYRDVFVSHEANKEKARPAKEQTIQELMVKVAKWREEWDKNYVLCLLYCEFEV